LESIIGFGWRWEWVHAFHFENGRVSYLNRWSKTSKWKQERKAGRSLKDGMNPMNADPLWNPEGEDELPILILYFMQESYWL